MAATPRKSTTSFMGSLGLAVIAAGRQAQQIFEDDLATLGLSMRHLGALGHLARNPELSISDLARRSGVTAQSMHATVRGLEERGAVVLHDQGRGRAAKVEVTDHGQDLLDQAAEAAVRLDAHVTDRLGPKDAAALQRINAKLIEPPRG